MQCPGALFPSFRQIPHILNKSAWFQQFRIIRRGYGGSKAPVRVTDSDGFDGLACFSPDGKTLSWTSNRTNDKKSQIFMANWNHKEMLKRLDSAQSIENIRQLEKSPSSVTKTSPEVEADDVVKHVKYLCSEKLGGRMDWISGKPIGIRLRCRLIQVLWNGTFFQRKRVVSKFSIFQYR